MGTLVNAKYVSCIIIINHICIGICLIGYYFFNKKYKCGVMCVTHFHYVCDTCEIDLVMDSFLMGNDCLHNSMTCLFMLQ